MHGMSRALADIVFSHKALFPMESSDWYGLICVILGLMVAAAGGIGGGGIIVPILIIVYGFEPKFAIPLSNFTILGCSLMNVALNLSKRHPDKDRPLVDWSLIMVMEPPTMAGAVFGAYLSKILPDWFLVISLMIVLGFTTDRTLKKGFSQYKKESEAFELANKSALSQVDSGIEMNNEMEQSVGLLERDETDDIDISFEKSNDHVVKSPELISMVEAERNTPLDRMYIILVMFVVVVVLNLVKGGGGAFHSPLGIECGSIMYWIVTAMIFVWLAAVAYYGRDILVAEYHKKIELGYEYASGDIKWDERNTLIYPTICIAAGFCAGMFGIGGGIVKGPLMLEMGIHPMVASGTTAVMIFFTAIVATTSFIAFGTLQWDYAWFLFFVGLAATAVGQHGVNHLVKKYNRFSFISLSIGAVVALSTILLGFQGVFTLLFPTENERHSNHIC